jgi:hypothetical protein
MHKIIFFIYCFIFINSILVPEKEIKKSNLLSNKDNNIKNNKNYNEYIHVYKRFDSILDDDLELDNSTNQTNDTDASGSSNSTSSLFNKIKLISFNYLHLSISFIIFPIVSLLLLFYDLQEDRKLVKKYNLSATDKARKDYTAFKNSYITNGIYLFSLFVMKYEYPLTNVFFVYNYNHPRYLRFLLFLIRIFLHVLLVVFILFKFLAGINNIMNYTKFVRYQTHINTFFISVAISLIMHIFYGKVTDSILEYDKKRRIIFKEKLENLRKYVYNVIKSDILLNSKWHSIRSRMITYYRICGATILKKNKDNTNKYKIYAEHKLKSSEPVRVRRTFRTNNSAFIIEGEEEANTTKSSFTENEIGNKTAIYEKIRANSNLVITKGVEPFSFSRFGVNHIKLKTLKKIEYIRNKYIKKKNVQYEETIDLDSYEKTFDNLSIEELESFTYISTDAMIDKLKHLNKSWSKMVKNIFTDCILFIILILINVGLVFMSNYKVRIKNEASNKPKWLMEMFFMSVTIDGLFYYLKCLYLSIRITNLYGKKVSNCFYKMLFDLFVEKYLRYLYRMRLLIIKYKKELDFM